MRQVATKEIPAHGGWLAPYAAGGVHCGSDSPVQFEPEFLSSDCASYLRQVHMNGRVMDPATGRFLSVDPVFQAPTNSQSVNPYSYVMNNPLALVDPSGYCGTDTTTDQCQTSGTNGATDRVYKGHNDTGSMDHLAGTKLAAFDKALGKANAALKAAFGSDSHVAFSGRGEAVAAINGNGAEVQQKIDIALSDQGKSAADKGGQSSTGDVATANLQSISGMSQAQIDDYMSSDTGTMVADNSGPSHPLGYYLPDPFSDSAVNAITGFGDGAYKAVTLGFGDLSVIRGVIGQNGLDFTGSSPGIDGGVDYNSSAYGYSKVAGQVVGGFAISGALGVKSFKPGGWLNSNRYLRIGIGKGAPGSSGWYFRAAGQLIKNEKGKKDFFKLSSYNDD